MSAAGKDAKFRQIRERISQRDWWDGGFIFYDGGNTVCLDGHFTVEELEQLAAALKEVTSEKTV